MKKRGPGRPLKGKVPTRQQKQISFRLTPELAKDWALIMRRNESIPQGEVFASIVKHFALCYAHSQKG